MLESNIKRIESVLKDIWFENTLGDEFKFVSFRNKNKCTLEFKDPYFVGEYNYSNALKGSVKNPIKPIVAGVGYLGTSSLSIYKGKTKTREYAIWNNMLKRCYDGVLVTYQDCTVCEEWHNFQNFFGWCKAQPEFVNEDWCLDKDILVRGNKLYSPETCSFVPRQINNLFTLRQNHRGADPIGVSWNKSKGYFTVNICRYGSNTELARVSDSKEGFKIYKQAKEDYIKEVAELWKGKIKTEVYEALINFQIEADV